VFLIFVARAVAPVWEAVWEVTRLASGVLGTGQETGLRQPLLVHIMDPEWGHLTIKMSGHPPFGAQVILNGHEYVATQAQVAGIGFAKEGNCFTRIADPQALAQIADTLSQPATIGRLTQVCDRWIYTACLCFGLDLDEQERSGFSYSYSVFQAEYTPQPAVTVGAQMDQVFDRAVDRTRARLDVPMLRTLFGAKQRPGRNGTPDLSLQLAAVIETPRYDLTLFKVHFGNLTLKAYTGEHVLHFEAVVHNTTQLRCGRVLDRFPKIITRLAGMVDRFATTLDCVDVNFIGDGLLDQLPLPAQIGTTRVRGVDLNKPRIRVALSAALALSTTPGDFTVTEFTTKVHTMTGQTDSDYTTRQGAYDLRKLRGKDLITKPGRTRRYQIPTHAASTIAALFILHDQVISPIMAFSRTASAPKRSIWPWSSSWRRRFSSSFPFSKLEMDSHYCLQPPVVPTVPLLDVRIAQCRKESSVVALRRHEILVSRHRATSRTLPTDRQR
jgi:hypothetical protein